MSVPFTKHDTGTSPPEVVSTHPPHCLNAPAESTIESLIVMRLMVVVAPVLVIPTVK